MMVFRIIAANTEDLRAVAILLGPGTGRLEVKYAEERRQRRMTNPPRGEPPQTSGDDARESRVSLDEATHPAE
jgi:hypothetical protein